MKTALLLSGGVDSSVALYLLKQQGYDVTAFYLKVWLEDELSFLGNCPWGEDLDYARNVCSALDVPLKLIQMQKDYLDTVVEYTKNELKAGRTPSPDVMCNRHIKFGKFIDKIDGSFELIASGHYARVEKKDEKYYLKSAPDAVKDQTYFLTYLSQEQLSKIIFPIGKFNKNEVRQLAHKFNLSTKSRKDSQGICFLGKIPYNEFVKYHLGEKPGDVIDIRSGKIISTHNGYWFFTIGQRHGLGLGGGPWYIVKKDIVKNIIYISTEKLNPSVSRDKFIVRDINWIPKFPEKTSFQVKLRHGPKKYNCIIEKVNDTKVIVQLLGKDEGIAAGQFAVFYVKEYCFGGGVIELISTNK
ncbi:MAG: tRNA 2-thiouridine(34) synthase MnmA [bacterium]